jgi:hypothetical protein
MRITWDLTKERRGCVTFVYEKEGELFSTTGTPFEFK